MRITRLGGLNSIQHTVRQLFFDFYRHLISLLDRRTRPRFFLVLKSLLLSVPLAFVPLPILSYAETNVPFQATFSLTKDARIVTVPQANIVFNSGESNTTIEFNQHRAFENEQLRKRAAQTAVTLRDLDSTELPNALSQFLTAQHSPFASDVPELVAAANQYDLDPRLLVGISAAESSFGLAMPTGSYNPFGLGPGMRFDSFYNAFLAEAQFLHHHFISRGVANPHVIGPSYTGTGSTSWGVAVAQVMSRI